MTNDNNVDVVYVASDEVAKLRDDGCFGLLDVGF